MTSETPRRFDIPLTKNRTFLNQVFLAIYAVVFFLIPSFCLLLYIGLYKNIDVVRFFSPPPSRILEAINIFFPLSTGGIIWILLLPFLLFILYAMADIYHEFPTKMSDTLGLILITTANFILPLFFQNDYSLDKHLLSSALMNFATVSAAMAFSLRKNNKIQPLGLIMAGGAFVLLIDLLTFSSSLAPAIFLGAYLLVIISLNAKNSIALHHKRKTDEYYHWTGRRVSNVE